MVRTSVAEPGRLYLTAKSATAVLGVVKVKDTMIRVSAGRERGGGPTTIGEASEGLARRRGIREAGDGVGEVGDAVVRVDGREVAGEAGQVIGAEIYGGAEESLVFSGLHVGVGADRLRTEPPHHGLNDGITRVAGKERACQPDATAVERERYGYRRPKCQGFKGVEGAVCLCVVRERTRRIGSTEQRGAEGRVGRVIGKVGQVHGSVAKVEGERVALRASREQNGAVACAQTMERHCWWAFKGDAADTPLEVEARHGGGVKGGGAVVKEVGFFARAKVPQGGEESGEAYAEVGFPVGNSVANTDGFGKTKPEDGCGLLIGESPPAGGDKGLWAVNPDGGGRAHYDVIVPVDSTDGV